MFVLRADKLLTLHLLHAVAMVTVNLQTSGNKFLRSAETNFVNLLRCHKIILQHHNFCLKMILWHILE